MGRGLGAEEELAGGGGSLTRTGDEFEGTPRLTSSAPHILPLAFLYASLHALSSATSSTWLSGRARCRSTITTR